MTKSQDNTSKPFKTNHFTSFLKKPTDSKNINIRLNLKQNDEESIYNF